MEKQAKCTFLEFSKSLVLVDRIFFSHTVRNLKMIDGRRKGFDVLTYVTPLVGFKLCWPRRLQGFMKFCKG